MRNHRQCFKRLWVTCSWRNQMQLRRFLLAGVSAALTSTFANAADEGDFCVIPKLQAGIPAEIPVPYIDKPYCGMAIIGQKYVRLSEVAELKEQGTPVCTASGDCTKTYLYVGKDRGDTYTLIFKGPKEPTRGA